MALDIVLIFAPTKEVALKQFRENMSGQELTHACQFHDCGCTEESCKTSCCCTAQHEVFEEIKKEESATCEDNADCEKEKIEPIKKPSKSFISQVVCKQGDLKEQTSIAKKDPIFISKQKAPKVLLAKNTEYVSMFTKYEDLETQIFPTPECPPPNKA